MTHNFSPKFCILMNAFNSSDTIAESISSALAQSYSNFELLIWDNCSSDNTPDIVRSFTDPRINYIRSDKHTTLGEARHLASFHIHADYLAFLDSDDIWYPNKLESQLPSFNDPAVGISISNTIFFNQSFRKICYNRIPPSGFVTKQLLDDYYVSLETLIVSMSFVSQLDYIFDPNVSHASDYDLVMRLSLISKMHYTDQILSGWRCHDSSETWTSPITSVKDKLYLLTIYQMSFPASLHHQLNKLKIRLNYSYIINLFCNCSSSARAYILNKKLLFSSSKIFIIFLLSFIPFSTPLLQKLLHYKRKLQFKLS